MTSNGVVCGQQAVPATKLAEILVLAGTVNDREKERSRHPYDMIEIHWLGFPRNVLSPMFLLLSLTSS